MSKGVKAGDAYIKVSLDGGEKAFRALQNRLRGIGTSLAATGGVVTAIGGSVLGVFGAAAKTFADNVDVLDKMQVRTGVSAKALSALGFAAEQSGSSIETVEKGLIGMAKTMAAAEDGAKTQTDALAKLGLTYEQLKGLAPEDQFTLLADRVRQVEDPTERAAVSMEVFGKAGQKLLPLFAEGAEGIKALTDEAEALGITMSGEDVAAAAALNDAMNRVNRQLGGVWLSIGAAVAGPLTELSNWTTQYIGMALKWLNANRDLVLMVAQVAAVVFAVGGALVVAGVAFQALAFVAGGLATGLAAVGAVLGFILSPLGLVVTALAAGATYFFGFTAAGRAMVDAALGYFGELGAIVGETFGGLRAALANGDIQAAGEVLWAGLQVLWLRGTAPLRELWTGFTRFFKDVWAAAVTGAAEWWNFLTGSLERGWSHSLGFVQDLWGMVYAGLVTGMNNLVGFFEKTWARIKGLFGGDAAAEIARINQELEASNQAIADDRDKAIVDRGAAREKAIADSRRRQEETAQALREDLDAKFEANAKGADDTLAAAEQKLADARAKLAELAGAQQAEAAARAELAAETAAKGAEGAAARNTKAGDSGSGTFNAAAIASLLRVGNDDTGDRTATATEATAANTAKIADKLGQPILMGA